ncbi:MAG: class I SAM-dependent RNA methyltransferase [Bacillota bacterium]|nr:class I SAM-dependent RNA methyltransferase [Bacillota bacterium]
MKNINLIATAAFGLESVVANELKRLGYDDLEVQNGRVCFQAGPEAIPRCNLWLRSADRLLIKIGEFEALSFEDLFEKTRALSWYEWLPEDACFPVEGKSIQSQLFSVPDCQAIVKKAIVEKMKEKYKCKWFDEKGSRYRIEVALLKNMATLTLDTSGVGLHKRGYRRLAGQAPIKETLAAALIHLSRWKPDRPLIDPFCGSGTIPIEAALIGRNIAPGLGRDFAAEKWPQFSAKSWKTAREEARDSIYHNQSLGIYGFDNDPAVLHLARQHARQAGFTNDLFFQQQDIKDLRSKYNYGYLITNPPYGERLSDTSAVQELCKTMGKTFAGLDTWSFYIISSLPQFENHFNRKADKKRKLYNGRLMCHYYQFYGPKPPRLEGPFSIKED